MDTGPLPFHLPSPTLVYLDQGIWGPVPCLYPEKMIGTTSDCLPFPKRQILDSSKLEEFADVNLNFDENGRKFDKQVENTGKKRNCSLEQFLLFPQCFQKTFTADPLKPGFVLERVN